MKTRMKALLTAGAGAMTAALLASSFALGGAYGVSAQGPEALAAARPDTVVISAAALDGLEQRLTYLEGIVASLSLSSQHIRTYQLCVSGDGGAETCVTQPQLDALLANQAHVAASAQPAGHAAAVPDAANETWKAEPESTGSISPALLPAINE
jgi:ABC-type hemin transport system substrate-binding protein